MSFAIGSTWLCIWGGVFLASWTGAVRGAESCTGRDVNCTQSGLTCSDYEPRVYYYAEDPRSSSGVAAPRDVTASTACRARDKLRVSIRLSWSIPVDDLDRLRAFDVRLIPRDNFAGSARHGTRATLTYLSGISLINHMEAEKVTFHYDCLFVEPDNSITRFDVRVYSKPPIDDQYGSSSLPASLAMLTDAAYCDEMGLVSTSPEQGGGPTTPEQGGGPTSPKQGGGPTSPEQGGGGSRPTSPTQRQVTPAPDSGLDNTIVPRPANVPDRFTATPADITTTHSPFITTASDPGGVSDKSGQENAANWTVISLGVTAGVCLVLIAALMVTLGHKATRKTVTKLLCCEPRVGHTSAPSDGSVPPGRDVTTVHVVDALPVETKGELEDQQDQQDSGVSLNSISQHTDLGHDPDQDGILALDPDMPGPVCPPEVARVDPTGVRQAADAVIRPGIENLRYVGGAAVQPGMSGLTFPYSPWDPCAPHDPEPYHVPQCRPGVYDDHAAPRPQGHPWYPQGQYPGGGGVSRAWVHPGHQNQTAYAIPHQPLYPAVPPALGPLYTSGMGMGHPCRPYATGPDINHPDMRYGAHAYEEGAHVFEGLRGPGEGGRRFVPPSEVGGAAPSDFDSSTMVEANIRKINEGCYDAFMADGADYYIAEDNPEEDSDPGASVSDRENE